MSQPLVDLQSGDDGGQIGPSNGREFHCQLGDVGPWNTMRTRSYMKLDKVHFFSTFATKVNQLQPVKSSKHFPREENCH